MKKLIIACFMIFGFAAAVNAQDTTSTTPQPSDQYRTDDTNTNQDTTSTDQDVNTNQDENTNQDASTDQGLTQDPAQDQEADRDDYTDSDAVSTSELPENIRQQLQSEDYSGWTISKAYKKMKDGKPCYKVELTNGSETKKVKFDEQGNVLKEKHKDKGDY